ncbi:MAG: SDR family oxidoreductase [Betaproteobacteria bacterium]|nr:SDR family oxidoreductase [Betaproteobacteria bacterium]
MKSPLDRFLLTDKVALVTGGSRGLGREMVLAFAQAGADVIIVSRKLDACETLARQVEATTGRRAMAYACHVGHWEELPKLVDAAYARFGKIDILVNNAGMAPVYDHIVNVTEALFDKVLEVNLKGPMRLSALIGTRMAEGAGGSIINISSAGAIHPRPDILPYAAAKAALNTITQSFAHTFGPKVRVNCIMPGTFLTDISKAWDLEKFQKRAQAFALKRGGEADEIVGAALYFASDASSYTTGSVLGVEGGQPL